MDSQLTIQRAGRGVTGRIESYSCKMADEDKHIQAFLSGGTTARSGGPFTASDHWHQLEQAKSEWR